VRLAFADLSRAASTRYDIGDVPMSAYDHPSGVDPSIDRLGVAGISRADA
jgi:hypothetical protein